MQTLPDIQLFQRPGIIEFGWGHPDSALLPSDGLARAAARTFEQKGRIALAYGAEQGPGQLIELVRARMGRSESTPPAEQLMITGGNSQALDMLSGLFAQAGDVVLVEAPTYHLALRIFRDRKLRIIAVPGDGQGISVDALEALIPSLRARGLRVAFLYLVPTFGNPSSAILPLERRHALAALAKREQLLIIEDDAYGELWYDGPPPPALSALADPGLVIRIGSYAKILAPGLRMGWLLASPEHVQRCALSGMLDSGGGVNHFTAHLVASFYELDLIEPHITMLRDTFRTRRDHLLGALARYLPDGCRWNPPLGGFFIWINLPQGVDSVALLPKAEAAGVSYLPGDRFFAEGGGQNYLRLSFSLLPIEELEAGAKILGDVLRQASH